MPKRPLKIVARIPSYRHPRNVWRKAIHRAVQERRGESVQYRNSDKLEVEILLYMDDALPRLRFLRLHPAVALRFSRLPAGPR